MWYIYIGVNMKIKCIVVGNLAENCYILEKKGKALIIDPGAEFSKILKELGNLEVIGALVTHHHFDHIGALKDVLEKYSLEENIVKDDDFKYEVIATPGHTNDSKTYYFDEDKVMFTGDFLFKESFGRVDLPTGSGVDMLSSLNKISKYPDNIAIYPGHGASSTLGNEKKYFSYYKQIL